MIPKDVKEEKTKPQELSFSSLPEEIVENILARISKWNYPNLSLISKRFLSLLSSPQLYKTRSYIGTTEPCLYFCLDLPDPPSPQWFTLWMKPLPNDEAETLTLTNDVDEIANDVDEIAYDFSLVPVPGYSTSHRIPFSTVAVGSEIYSIGGAYKVPPSSPVHILDCWTHTWRDGPSMLVARSGAEAFFLHEKIYVMGGSEKDDTWMDVFDIKTQTWKALASHGAVEFRKEWILLNSFQGKIYGIADEKDFAYDPKEDTWDVVKTHSGSGHIDVWCEIEGVMYCYTNSGCTTRKHSFCD